MYTVYRALNNSNIQFRKSLQRYARKHHKQIQENYRAWAKRNPDKIRAKELRRNKRNPRHYFLWCLKKRYGLTLEQYNNMLLKQKYRCAICKERTKLHIDHDHKTRKVRGLLCFRCNVGIGHLKNLIVLKAAIQYLDTS